MNYKEIKKLDKNTIYEFHFQNKIFFGTVSDFYKPIYYKNHKTRYVVDIVGNVYNTKSNKKLTAVLSSGNYYRIGINVTDSKRKSVSVHRLVAEAFIPNPENKPDVNHKDGNKSHNYLWNLEWCTKSENVKHAFANGLNTNKGEINPKSKLTNENLEEIWKLLNSDEKISFVSIAKMYGVGKSTISSIYSGKTWSDFYKKYSKGYQNKIIKYTDSQIKRARELYKNGYHYSYISKITGINKGYLFNVLNNVNRKEV